MTRRPTMATVKVLSKDGIERYTSKASFTFDGLPSDGEQILSWDHWFYNPTGSVETVDSIYKIGSAKVVLIYHKTAGEQLQIQARIEAKTGSDLEKAVEFAFKKVGGGVATIYPDNPTPDSFIRGVANDIRTFVAWMRTKVASMKHNR
jgi:hypothetical protein